MNILFTCIGRRVELIQEFKKQSNSDTVVFVCGTDSSNTAPASVFCDAFYTVPRINESAYIPELLRICEKEKIDILIPTIDTDLLILSENSRAFDIVGTKVLVSDYEIVKKCRDKRKTGAIFGQAGLNNPASVDDIEQYHLGFPAFIKPLNGSSSIDAYRVDSEQELCDFAIRMPNYIIQPFIDGEEYTIDILCDFFGNPIYITPRKRIAVRSGEVLKTEIDLNPIMIEEAKRLVSVMKPCGPITVQLIKEKITGVNWYIEINPRFGGGAPLSMKAGANSAQALVYLLNGQKIEYTPNAAEDHAVFCRFDQSVKL